MEILTYNDMDLRVSGPVNPGAIIREACDVTMKSSPFDMEGSSDVKLLAFLIDAEHTSVFEHVNFTIRMHKVSRSFLAQITRHRMGSFTSGSQHYQDYRDYPVIVHPRYKTEFEARCWECDEDMELDGRRFSELEVTFDGYSSLVNDNDVPPEEARQLLPNAAAVNLLWTVNARSLLNFFRQRCCNRNTAEMQLFANRLRQQLVLLWPGMAELVGPACWRGSCNQGVMQCKQGAWSMHTTISVEGTDV
jgi:thymidylate synthase (FAD)